MQELAKYMTDHYMVILYEDGMNLFKHKSIMSQQELNQLVFVTHDQGGEWILTSRYGIRSSIDMFNDVCQEIDAREVVYKVAKRFGVDKDAKTFY